MYIFNITKWVQVDPMDPCKSPSRGQGSVQGTVQEGRLLTGLRQCGLASNCDCTWHTIALCFLASFYQQCKAWRLEARWDKEAEIKSLILVRHSQNWRYPWLFFFGGGILLAVFMVKGLVVLAMTCDHQRCRWSSFFLF